jgi:hypothetical protein
MLKWEDEGELGGMEGQSSYILSSKRNNEWRKDSGSGKNSAVSSTLFNAPGLLSYWFLPRQAIQATENSPPPPHLA